MVDHSSKLPPALLPPDPAYRIRPVQANDVDALLADVWADRSRGRAINMIERALRNLERGRGIGIVVLSPEQAGRVIAYGQLTIWTHCAEISDLIVSSEQRGRGVGTAMIRYLVAHARQEHLRCVEIGAARSNPRALALYRRLGFQEAYQLMLNLGQGVEPVAYLRLEIQDTPL